MTAVCPGTVDTEFLDLALDGEKLPPYKRLVLSDPKKVVSCAISDSLKGKEMSVYGPVMNVFQVLCKVLPHGLIMKFIQW